jgi:hypothetical protein
VAQEVNGGGPKNTLLCIDDQAMLSKTKEHLPEMETVLNVVFAGHLQIVLVCKAELQMVLHPLNLPLEGVASVLQTKRHASILE